MAPLNPLAAARRIVVKVGSSLLVAEDGAPDRAWLDALCADLAAFRAEGRQLLIVSSGAIALGRRRLGLTRRPSLAENQAAAAAGQSLLMRAWETALEPHAIAAAQILLTRDDTEVRRRWLNARDTVETLLRLSVVPVVNENDTVATEEIRYGDNDRLAARVAQMVGADALVLLSDVDGLYTADPRRDGAARHIPHVAAITPALEAAAGAASPTGVGRGGMATKLAAARIAQAAGCATVITLGRRSRPLRALTEGAPATVIAASTTPAAAYKAWIAGSLSPQGALTVDPGCAAALLQGRSLLPAGVRAVEGRFDKGDAVVIRDAAGRELARGLVEYDADEARRIIGLRSDALEAALGWRGPDELIHRDDLVLSRP